jgi:hypothetical protein
MASSRADLVLVLVLLAACSGGRGGTPSADDPTDAGVDAATYEATEIDLDLGHVTQIGSLQRAGDRALSTDATGRWVLWDIASHQALASGELCAGCSAVLRGGTVAAGGNAGIEVRSAVTGSLGATIAVNAPSMGLSSDGTYVWAATASSLRAWSPQGTMLLDVPRGYAAARVFAAPTELRVAAGPAGASTIEVIQLSGGARSTVSFAGTFHSWFDDGERFLTAVGTVVRAYARTGAQLALAALPTVARLTGQGGYVWTFDPLSDPSLRIYAAANLDAPVQTYQLLSQTSVFPSGAQIGLQSTTPVSETFEIISLGSSVTRSGPTPIPINGLSSFGSDPSGWLIGSTAGVVLDSAAVLGTSADRRALSFGTVSSIAGAQDGTAVVSTASGRAPVLALGASTTVISHELKLKASHAELSQDATLLVGASLDGAQYEEDRSLRVLRVADGAEIYTWPYRWSDYPDLFLGFSFAREGLVLCHLKVQVGTTGGQRIYTDVMGTTLPTYGPAVGVGSNVEDTQQQLPRFSPDGTHAAFKIGSELVQATTQLYTNGVLVGAVPGVSLAWIDNDHLLVATYRLESSRFGIFTVQDKTFLYDPTGTQTVPVPLPPLTDPLVAGTSQFYGLANSVIPVGGTLIYSRSRNAVIDYTTGAKTWQGDPAVTSGVIVGGNVLFTRGTHLYRAAFR